MPWSNPLWVVGLFCLLGLALLTRSQSAYAQVQCTEELGSPALLVNNTLGQIVEVTNMGRRTKAESLVVTSSGQILYNIAVAPDGKLYGVTGNGSKAALFEIDWSTGARTQIANYAHYVPQTDGAIMRSNALTFGPDNKAYIASSPDYTRIDHIPPSDRRGEAHRYNFTTSAWELWTIFDQWDNRTFNPSDRPIYSAGDFFFTDGYVYTIVFLEAVLPTDQKEYYLWRFAVDGNLNPTSMDVMGKFSREVNGAGMTSDGRGYIVTSGSIYQMGQIPTTPGGGSTNIPLTYVGDLDNRTSDPLPPKVMGATGRTESVLATLPTCFSLKASTDIAAGTTADSGSKFTYTLTITNDSAVPSTGADKVKATSVVVEHAAPVSSYTHQASKGSYSNSLWNVGDLAQGESATLKMTVDVGASSPMDIIAQVKSVDQLSTKFTPGNLSGDPSEPDETKASVKVLTPKSADLELAMSSDASGPVDVGTDVVFTLTVQNKGPEAASNVVVTDKLPDGFTFKSADSADYDDGTGKWTIGTLAKGGSKTLKITATVNVSGDHKNVATVTGTENDPAPNNNQAEVITTLKNSSDLRIKLGTSPDGPAVGYALDYTMEVENKGLSDATNVVATLKMPSGVSFVSTLLQGYDSATGEWTIGNLAKGEIRYGIVVMMVNASGDFKNVASITADQVDPDTSNNQSEWIFTVAKTADLALSMTSNVAVGKEVVFTLTVKNQGPDGASNVVVTDKLPDGFTFKSADSADYDDGTGKWTIGDLAKDGTKTLKITASVNASGNHKNVATVTGTEVDLKTDDNKAEVSITPLANSDLALSMTSDASGPVGVGQDVVFTLTAQNKGPETANNVVVTDKLPDGFTFKSADSTDYDSATGKWSIGTLAKDGTKTLKITASVNASGDLKNVASITGEVDDPVSNNNQAEVSITPLPNSDLALSMTSDASGPVDVGKDVVFTLTAQNKGPDGASNVVVTDKLPNGFTFKSADSADYDSATGKWSIGTLAKGGSKTLKITASVNASGDLKNVASITGEVDDPDPNNNQAEVSITSQANSDLALSMTSDASGPLDVGKDVVFTLTVQNKGPETASNVVVTDKLPDGFTFKSADSTDYDATTGQWPVGTLAKDGTKTLKITATVNASGDHKNVATVTGRETDPDPNNNQAEVSITPQANSDLAVSVDMSMVSNRSNIITAITAENKGPDDASNVAVTVVLPYPNTYGIVAVMGSGYDKSTGIWTIGNLAKGETRTLSIGYSGSQGVLLPGLHKSSATMTGAENDPDLSNNQAEAEYFVLPNSDLALSMTSDASGPVDVGKDVVFTLTAQNKGPDGASNVVVTDKLPDGFTFKSADSTDYADGTGKWTIGDLAKDGAKTLKITASVNASGDYKNVASITGEVDDPDPNNNQAEVSITSQANSDLALSMTSDASGPVDVGTDVVFTLTVQNKGPEAASNVVVTDKLPDGFTFKSADSTDYADGTGKWTIGTLAKDGTKTLKITASVNASGDHKNVATLTGAENDPDTSNNQAEVSITPQANSDLAVVSVDMEVIDRIGNMFTYVEVENKGPDDASNVAVTVVLPYPKSYIIISFEGSGYDKNTGIWTIGNLAKGETRHLSIGYGSPGTEALIPGLHKSSATMTGAENDPDPSNNQVEAEYFVIPKTDLALSMTSDASGPVDVGKDVVFTLTAQNKGPSDASNVVVTDKLPDGFTFKSADSTDYDATTGQWSIGTLVKDETKTLKITAAVNASGDHKNVASIAGEVSDLDSKNDQAEVTIQVNLNTGSDLSIAVIPDITTTYVGKEVAFTLTAQNQGPDPASNIVVTNKLPDGFTFVSADSADYDDTTGEWSVGKLDVSYKKKLKIIATVNANGDYKNVATIVGDELDRNLSNNTASVEITAIPESDLALAMTSDVLAAQIDAEVSFTLSVTNNGPSDASNVVVTDKLPDGFTFVSADSADYDDGSGEWSVGDLAKDARKDLQIKAKINAVGDHKNVASVSGDEHDLNPLNDKVVLSIEVEHRIDLELDQKISPSVTPYGSEISIDLTLINKGPSVATGVVVTNRFPSGLSFVSANSASYDSANGEWSVKDLAKDETVTLQLKAKVKAKGDYKNKAEVTAAKEKDVDSTVGNAVEGKGEDDETEVELTDFGTVDLQISTIAIPVVAVNEGDTVNVSITASNKGDIDAAQVSLDTGRFQDVFCETKTALGNNFNSDGSAAILSAGDSAFCVASMRTTASDAAAGKISVPLMLKGEDFVGNDASSAVKTLDIFMSSYDSKISDTLELNKAVTAVVDADQSNSLNVGDTVNYELVVRNKGTGMIQGVTITDSELDSFVCPAKDLQVDEVLSCTGSYVVQGSDAGKVRVNTATVRDIRAEHYGSDSASILVDDGNFPDLPSISFRQIITSYQDLSKDNVLSVGDKIAYKMIVTNSGNTSLGSLKLDVPWLTSMNCSLTLDTATVLKPAQTLECTSSYVLQDSDVKDSSLFAPVASVSARPVGVKSSLDTLSIYASDRAGLVIMKDPQLVVQMIALPSEGVQAGNTLVYSTVIKHASKSVGSAASVQITDSVNGQLSNKNCSLYAGNKPITSPQPWNDGGALANDGSYIECLSYQSVEADDFKSGSVSNTARVLYKIPGTNTSLSSTATYSVSQASTGGSDDIRVVSRVTGDPSSSGDDPATSRIDESVFWGEGDTVSWQAIVTNTSSEKLKSWGTTSSLQGGTLDCPDTSSISPGDSRVCTYRYVLSEADEGRGFVHNVIDAYGDMSNAAAISSISNRMTSTLGQPNNANRVSTSTQTSLPTSPETQIPGLAFALTITGKKDLDGNNKVTVGDILEYELVATNMGHTTLRDVKMTDGLTSGLSCKPSTLAVGASMICPASYTVKSSDIDGVTGLGQIKNSALVEAFDAASGQLLKASDQFKMSVVGSVLSVTMKTIPNKPVYLGDQILHLIQVKNQGTVDAEQVTLSSADLNSFNCNKTAKNGQNFSLGGSLPPGDHVICVAQRTVTQSDVAVGDILSRVKMEAKGASPKSAEITLPVIAEPTDDLLNIKMSLMKNRAMPQNVGDTIHLDIVVSNVSGKSINNVSIDVPGVSDLDCSPHTLPLEKLKVGEKISCTGSRKATQEDIAQGIASNPIKVGGVQGGKSVEEIDDTNLVVVDAPVPQLAVNAWLDNYEDLDKGSFVSPGDVLNFKVNVANVGTTALNKVALKTSFAATVTGGAASANATMSAQGSVASNQTVSCGGGGNIPTTLDVGAQVDCTLSYKVLDTDVSPGDDNASIVLSAIATAEGQGPDSTNLTVSASEYASVSSGGSTSTLGVAKNLTDLLYDPDKDNTVIMTFDFVVSNMGGTTRADEIQLLDDLETAFADGYQSIDVLSCPQSVGTVRLTPNCAYSGQGDDKQLLVGSDSLDAGESGQVRMVVSVTFKDGGLRQITNIASISAKTPAGEAITDVATNGLNPDPNNDENPNEEVATIFDVVPSTQYVTMSKVSSSAQVERGNPVGFVLSATNTLTTPINIDVVDLMPPGFNYRSNTARIIIGDDSAQAKEPEIDGTYLWWKGIELEGQQTVIIELIAIPSVGAKEGKYRNQACATVDGSCVSNTAWADVSVVPSGIYDCSTVLGQVFVDSDSDGVQDDGEIGLPGVRLGSPDGLFIYPDSKGKFSIPCADTPDIAKGSNYILKLDESTLPVGYALTTENPRAIRLTAGKAATMNFGVAKRCNINMALEEGAFTADSVRMHDEWAAYLNDVLGTISTNPNAECTLDVNLVACGKDNRDLNIRRAKLLGSYLAEQWAEMGNRPLNTDVGLISQIRKNCESNKVQLPSSLPAMMSQEATEVHSTALSDSNVRIPEGYKVFRNSRGNLLLAPIENR